MTEIRKTVCFLLLTGLVSPSFDEYMYFFQMNVVNFSKYQYALLNVLSFASIFIGTLLYNNYLKDKEFRTMLSLAIWVGLVGSMASLAFVLRLNVTIGINDNVFIFFTDVVTSSL